MTKTSEKFWDDVTENYTPDLPTLRYGGPIPVFLYGDIAKVGETYQRLNKMGLKNVTDYKVVTSTCLTTGRFSLIKNVNPNNGIEHSDFMMSDVSRIKSTLDLTQRQVRGKLLTVSVRAIRKLDRMFYNQHRARRMRLSLADPHKSFGHEWAWGYIFPKSYLTNENVEDNVFNFRKEEDFKVYKVKDVDGNYIFDSLEFGQ